MNRLTIRQHIGKRSFRIYLACTLLSICSLAATASSFDYSSRVGVVIHAETNWLLNIPNKKVKQGAIVVLVFPGKQSYLVSHIAKSLTSVEAHSMVSHMDLQGTNMDYQQGIYLLDTKLAFSGYTALGIVTSGTKFQIVNGTIVADLDDDGMDEYFRNCFGNEGEHLTIWTGKPLEGKRRFHKYYYLGYDTESNCTNKDY